MTLVIMQGDQLYADRKSVENVCGIEVPVTGSKVFGDKRMNFLASSTGTVSSGFNQEIGFCHAVSLFENFIRLFKDDIPKSSFDLIVEGFFVGSTKLAESLQTRATIFMVTPTFNLIFDGTKTNNAGRFVQVSKSDLTGGGSGFTSALAFIKMGRSIEDAFRKTVRIDVMTGASFEEFKLIKAKNNKRWSTLAIPECFYGAIKGLGYIVKNESHSDIKEAIYTLYKLLSYVAAIQKFEGFNSRSILDTKRLAKIKLHASKVFEWFIRDETVDPFTNASLEDIVRDDWLIENVGKMLAGSRYSFYPPVKYSVFNESLGPYLGTDNNE